MSFTDVLYEDVEEGAFTRTDLTPYREVFDNLKPGKQATIVVPTGIIKDGEKKGEDAKRHERGFRSVAAERNVGLRVGHNNMPDGKTRLKLTVGPKREFTPEALKNRAAALERKRAAKAAEAAKAAPAAAPAAPAAAPAATPAQAAQKAPAKS